MASERRSTDAEILTALGVLEERVAAINTRTIRLVRLLEGNGEPGLKTRVDRLEQHHKRQSGYHGVWFAAVVTAVVAWLAKHLGGN